MSISIRLTNEEADWLLSLTDFELMEWMGQWSPETQVAIAKRLANHKTAVEVEMERDSEKVKRSPASLAEMASYGRWKCYPHLNQLDQAITDSITGRMGRRLIVTMPPRHGKSELISRFTPAWYLGNFPDQNVILASYEADFASSWGGKARQVLREFGHLFNVEVDESISAAGRWSIDGREGGMLTAGVGGPITGKGAGLLIVDDPIKNSEEAKSLTIREKLWEWWQSTAYTRLEPDGVAIVLHTRWHRDDLIGRLISEMDGGGEKWRVLNLPAIGHDGAALWPERFPVERLLEIKKALGSYYWSALYQQSPIPEGQGLFKRDDFGVPVSDYPKEAALAVRYWDKAGSSTDGDFSAGVLMTMHKGIYYIVDVVHGRWSPFERNQVIEQTAEIDADRFGGNVSLWIEREPGNGGKESAMISVRDLARFGPRTETPQKDKEARASNFAAQVEAKNVRIVKGKWNKAYLDELCDFPNGAHDDQVDGSSGAFNKLTQKQGAVGRAPVSSRKSRFA